MAHYLEAMTLALSSYFNADVVAVARRLIGARFLVHGIGGTIVETEAYALDDPASHSFRGPTQRNGAMFASPGTIYVYRSYGIHWCVNLVCRPGNAVLIRALAPTDGVAIMRERRGNVPDKRLCAGPGCLSQALAIDIGHNGLSIADPSFTFEPAHLEAAVAIGPRIGITKAADLPWRFGALDSPFVSRPFKASHKSDQPAEKLAEPSRPG